MGFSAAPQGMVLCDYCGHATPKKQGICTTCRKHMASLAQARLRAPKREHIKIEWDADKSFSFRDL